MVGASCRSMPHFYKLFLCWSFLYLLAASAAMGDESMPMQDHSAHMNMGQDHSAHMGMAAASGEVRRSVASYEVPAVRLTDMEGQDAAMAEALPGDVPVVLDFIFTTCTTICPVMSAILVEAQDTLRQEGVALQLVSVSIDPEYDSPARLADYADRYGARPGWRLFTGSPDDSMAVQKAFDAYRGGKFSHLPVAFLRRPGETDWVRLEGFPEPADIVREFRPVATH